MKPTEAMLEEKICQLCGEKLENGPYIFCKTCMKPLETLKKRSGLPTITLSINHIKDKLT